MCLIRKVAFNSYNIIIRSINPELPNSHVPNRPHKYDLSHQDAPSRPASCWGLSVGNILIFHALCFISPHPLLLLSSQTLSHCSQDVLDMVQFKDKIWVSRLFVFDLESVVFSSEYYVLFFEIRIAVVVDIEEGSSDFGRFFALRCLVRL
jgi:hypothetical protein